ncbi:hypothetical protein PCE1_000630 [Barthelona sp. PCE]
MSPLLTRLNSFIRLFKISNSSSLNSDTFNCLLLLKRWLGQRDNLNQVARKMLAQGNYERFKILLTIEDPETHFSASGDSTGLSQYLEWMFLLSKHAELVETIFECAQPSLTLCLDQLHEQTLMFANKDNISTHDMTKCSMSTTLFVFQLLSQFFKYFQQSHLQEHYNLHKIAHILEISLATGTFRNDLDVFSTLCRCIGSFFKVVNPRDFLEFKLEGSAGLLSAPLSIVIDICNTNHEYLYNGLSKFSCTILSSPRRQLFAGALIRLITESLIVSFEQCTHMEKVRRPSFYSSSYSNSSSNNSKYSSYRSSHSSHGSSTGLRHVNIQWNYIVPALLNIIATCPEHEVHLYMSMELFDLLHDVVHMLHQQKNKHTYKISLTTKIVKFLLTALKMSTRFLQDLVDSPLSLMVLRFILDSKNEDLIVAAIHYLGRLLRLNARIPPEILNSRLLSRIQFLQSDRSKGLSKQIRKQISLKSLRALEQFQGN